MPQWTIKSVSNEPICTVKSVERHGQLMSGRWLTVDIDSPIALPLSAGCYIDFNNVRYSIRSQADVEKSARPQSNGGAFTYKDLRLDDVSWQELEDTQMCDYVYGDNHLHYSGLGTFSFFAVNASDVGYRVLANLANKYGDSAWDVRINGSSIKSDYADYTFDEAKSIGISSGTNVKETLDLLWSNWGVYYTVENHVVDIITSSSGVSIPLRYGKNNGLKSIRRKINPNVEICTRVRAYGSERNMPYKWYNNKYPLVFGAAMYVPQLMLPHYAYVQNGEFIDANGDLYTSGTQVNLWSNPSDIVLPSKSEILTKYGKRDKEVHWNSDDMGEIFPSMKGMTKSEVGVDDSWVWNESDGRLDKLLSTAVNEDGTTITGTGDTSELTTGKINFKVRVPNPGFDPMSQKGQEDVVLLMQSGMCQSRGFVILKSEAVTDNEQVVAYDLTCVKAIDDEIDQVFPNGTYTIEGGQEYVYTGLTFSGNDLSNSWLAVYIGAAEKRLLRAAALWLREHQTEQYVFEITPDNVYLQRKKDEAEESNEEFDIIEGDTISLSQDDLGDSDEVVETVTVVYGKETIPTYEITFLKRDESESLGDRVKGLVGQTISVDSDIAKMNDSLYRKVNKAGFHTLFDPLDAQYNVLDINGDLSTLRYIRANVDFFGVSGVTALGRSSGGGGGGGSADLNALLDSINDSSIGNTLPTLSENGKCPVWVQTTDNNGHWEWGTTDGEGGGVTLREPISSINSASLGTPTESGQVITWNGSQWIYAIPQGGGGTGTVTSITAGTGLSGGTITTAGTISISSTYLTQIGEGHTAYGWGNHADKGYLKSSDIADMATKTWVNEKGFVTANNYLTSVTGSANGTMTFAREGLSPITFNSSHTHTNYVSSISYNNSATLTSPYYVVTSGSISGNTLTLGRRKLSDLLNTAGYTWWGETMNAGGVVEGNMTSVGNISFSSSGKSIGGFMFFDTTNNMVGIGQPSPSYKLDVSGNVNTTTAYYLNGKLFADQNNGLHIGYGFADVDLPTTIWGNGISFRSAGGTYGGCTKIDDTHGNITYGIMATDFIGVTNKFRFEYDLQNNTVWVLKADGTAVNFASLGGVTSLGVGSSGTPNISSMNIATLMTTNTTVGNQLNIGTSGTNNGQINFYDADEIGGASIAVNSGDLHITSDSTTYIESLLSVDGNITADGEVRGTSLHTSGGNLTMDGGDILMGGGKIYLDSTRYIYLNGSNLMYYNGTSSINVA